jgi:NitT/TauT family transport system substrate-binding protein
MKDDECFSRRRFLGSTLALSAVGLFNSPTRAASEPPPEIKRIRLINTLAACTAPQYIVEDLLHAQGFTEVQYVPFAPPAGTYTPMWLSGQIGEGIADFTMGGIAWWPSAIDSGAPLVVLAGIHAGCLELFGNGNVHSVRDLKGKRVAATEGGDDRLFISVLLSYVGIDPRRDVEWMMTPSFTEPLTMFVDGKVDAFLAFPPHPQELRARKIGHVILNTTIDRPWSQYFCCMFAGNRDFVRKYPIATKKVLRAFLEAADFCASDANRAARYMVNKGHVKDFEYAFALLTELPYNRWREADPEDTVRFHSLRLHELGMIKTTPQKIIGQGTDWRFLNELKKELKA